MSTPAIVMLVWLTAQFIAKLFRLPEQGKRQGWGAGMLICGTIGTFAWFGGMLGVLTWGGFF